MSKGTMRMKRQHISIGQIVMVREILIETVDTVPVVGTMIVIDGVMTGDTEGVEILGKGGVAQIGSRLTMVNTRINEIIFIYKK